MSTLIESVEYPYTDPSLKITKFLPDSFSCFSLIAFDVEYDKTG